MSHKTAHRKIGVVSPVTTVGVGPGGFGNGKPRTGSSSLRIMGGPDQVYIFSENPPIDVVGTMFRPASPRPPKARYDTTERDGLVSLTRYAGHDPYDLTIPIRFDAYASQVSVEGSVRALESLAERTGPDQEPPIVRVVGPHPYLTLKSTVRWRVSSITWDEDSPGTIYLPGGSARSRASATVDLIQHVTDKQLTESVRRGKRAHGIANRSTTARAGEYLEDVSRREYGDPSRASDIARANPGLRLGSKLKVGQRVRLPA